MSFTHQFRPKYGAPHEPVQVDDLDRDTFLQIANLSRQEADRIIAERAVQIKRTFPRLLGEFTIQHLGLTDRRAQIEAIIAHLQENGVTNPVFRGHDALSLVPQGVLLGANTPDKVEEKVRKHGFYATQAHLWRELSDGGSLSQKDPFFHMLYRHDSSNTARTLFPSLIVFDKKHLESGTPGFEVDDPDTIFFAPQPGLNIEDTVVSVYYPSQ
ncbi:MAG: hypothetical protein WAQ25_00950 [Candidatus Saccharimonas sp.]